jgi:hypothetical protein
MKYCKILTIVILSLAVYTIALPHSYCDQNEKACWNFITYLQANNNLIPFSDYNLNEMQKVGSTSEVNILAQWEKPTATQTIRYKVKKSHLQVKDKINKTIKNQPERALKGLITWAQKQYPAERYALILWNHGNGVLDRSNLIPQPIWLSLIGKNFIQEDRGILYDYSANTFLDNIGLSKVCHFIKKKIRQKIDFLGMDANLMSMIEIAYQIDKSVNYMVGSQQTESVYGWPYAAILKALTDKPHMCTSDFAVATVKAYNDFYAPCGSNEDSSFTLSAIDLSRIKQATLAFDALLQALILSQSVNKSTTNTCIKIARSRTLEFYVSDYIDLIDWYDNLTTVFTSLADSLRNKHSLIHGTRGWCCEDYSDTEYCTIPSGDPHTESILQKTNAILTTLATAKSTAQEAIIASKAGSDYEGKAHGLSLYYPRNYQVDDSYTKTDFAKKTFWVHFLKKMRE